jgi:predicted TIM-barrel fold metal-dependent hydrolase
MPHVVKTAQVPWRISSDTHVVEPPDLFTSRMSPRYREYAPRLEFVDGVEMWVADEKPGLPAFVASRAGDRFEPAESRPRRAMPSTYSGATFADDVRPGGYEPDIWLKDNYTDGVFGGVVFASLTMIFYRMVPQTEVLNDILRAYNDWVLDFASYDPDRIKPVTMLSFDDIDWAIAEMTRTRERGSAGAIVPVRDLHSYDSERYERFWSAAEDLDLPLAMHVATERTNQPFHFTHGGKQPHIAGQYTPPEMLNVPDMAMRTTLAEMTMSGVFARHPKLMLVSVEHEASWLPYFMERMDWHYQYNLRTSDHGYRYPNGALPSDYIRQNVMMSFTEDTPLMRLRDIIGVDRLMWGSDYPHAESTFPRSDALLAATFTDVPVEEQALMVRDNCARFYGFDTAAIEKQAATPGA